MFGRYFPFYPRRASIGQFSPFTPLYRRFAEAAPTAVVPQPAPPPGPHGPMDQAMQGPGPFLVSQSVAGTPDAQLQPGSAVVVNREGVYFRDSPAFTSQPRTTLPNGTQVRVLDRPRADGWVAISIEPPPSWYQGSSTPGGFPWGGGLDPTLEIQRIWQGTRGWVCNQCNELNQSGVPNAPALLQLRPPGPDFPGTVPGWG